MEELQKLIEVLESSIWPNGKDTVLTVGRLISICKKVQRELEEEDFESEMEGNYLDSF